MTIKMQELIIYLQTNPSIIGFFVACLIGMVFSRRHLKDLKTAEKMIIEQFDPSPNSEVNSLIESIKKGEARDRVIREFYNIRQAYGHDGVKKGHIFWVLHKIEHGLPEDGNIPPFIRKETK